MAAADGVARLALVLRVAAGVLRLDERHGLAIEGLDGLVDLAAVPRVVVLEAVVSTVVAGATVVAVSTVSEEVPQAEANRRQQTTTSNLCMT